MKLLYKKDLEEKLHPSCYIPSRLSYCHLFNVNRNFHKIKLSVKIQIQSRNRDC